jgi:hypothetical protein
MGTVHLVQERVKRHADANAAVRAVTAVTDSVKDGNVSTL